MWVKRSFIYAGELKICKQLGNHVEWWSMIWTMTPSYIRNHKHLPSKDRLLLMQFYLCYSGENWHTTQEYIILDRGAKGPPLGDWTPSAHHWSQKKGHVLPQTPSFYTGLMSLYQIVKLGYYRSISWVDISTSKSSSFHTQKYYYYPKYVPYKMGFSQ